MKMIYEAPEIFDSMWQHVDCLIGLSADLGDIDIDVNI